MNTIYLFFNNIFPSFYWHIDASNLGMPYAFNSIFSVGDYVLNRLPYNPLNELIVILIESFIILMLILLPSIFSYKIVSEGYRRRKKFYFKKYLLLIRSYFQTDKSKEIFDELNATRYNFRRNVLISVLMFLEKFDTRYAEHDLRQLYFDLGLDKDSSRKLKNVFWDQKIQGIRELSQLRVKKKNAKLVELLQSDNDVLRNECQLGLIKLLPFVPFAFLDSLDRPFTVWEQMNVYKMLKEKKIEIPEFQLWLGHWNDTVVMFSLDMIRILYQREAVPAVLELLEHPNENIKAKVIRTLIDIGSVDSVPKMKEIFVLEDIQNQVNIVKSISNLKLVDELPFFESLLSSESFEMKMEAAKAIGKIPRLGQKRLQAINKNADAELSSIILHVISRL